MRSVRHGSIGHALGLSLSLAACEVEAEPGDAMARDASSGGPAVDAAAPRDSALDASSSPDVALTPDAGPSHVSEGCSAMGTLEDGEHRFVLGGRDRRYVLRLPVGDVHARPWPLVLALHGNGGSATEWDRESGSQNVRAAVREHAILVVAEAIDGQWRDYTMPEASWPARIDEELAYFDHVIDEVEGALCVDRRAIFAMGFSGGGSFSSVLACRRDDVRAIAVGGSVLYVDLDTCGPSATAAWITIGDMESNAGRTTFRDAWRDRGGCSATSTSSSPAGCVSYDDCEQATPVTFCSHAGGHVWPAFGTEAAWSFFASLLPDP